jgi:hypothetical protein
MRLDASLPLSAPASEKAPIIDDSIERGIGLGVAELAATIARGLIERADGGLRKETRNEGADLLARLARVKMHHAGFDAVARKWGMQALIEHISSPPDPQVPDEAMVEKLIDATLALLRGLIKQACN